MKCLSDQELADLRADVDSIVTERQLIDTAQALVRRATVLGLVLTIEQQPLQPLAMGHHQTVVTVRPGRVPA